MADADTLSPAGLSTRLDEHLDAVIAYASTRSGDRVLRRDIVALEYAHATATATDGDTREAFGYRVANLGRLHQALAAGRDRRAASRAVARTVRQREKAAAHYRALLDRRLALQDMIAHRFETAEDSADELAALAVDLHLVNVEMASLETWRRRHQHRLVV